MKSEATAQQAINLSEASATKTSEMQDKIDELILGYDRIKENAQKQAYSINANTQEINYLIDFRNNSTREFNEYITYMSILKQFVNKSKENITMAIKAKLDSERVNIPELYKYCGMIIRDELRSKKTSIIDKLTSNKMNIIRIARIVKNQCEKRIVKKKCKKRIVKNQRKKYQYKKRQK